MALYLVLQDFVFPNVTLLAGTVVDDTQIRVNVLNQSGLLTIPYVPALHKKWVDFYNDQRNTLGRALGTMASPLIAAGFFLSSAELEQAKQTLELVDEPSAARTLSADDMGKTIRSLSSDPTVFTVPDSAGWPEGALTFSLLQGGAGALSIVGAGGITVRARSGKTTTLAGVDAYATVVRTGPNAWLVFGELEASP